MRPSRELLRRAVAATSTAALLAAAVLFCLSRGPLTLRPPATVLSNAHWVMKGAEPYLLYLKSLSRRIPPDATIVVLSPYSKDDAPTGTSYLIALGQLPAQRVLPWTVLRDPGAEPPRYVAVFRRGFSDHRYRLVGQTADDQLWELATSR